LRTFPLPDGSIRNIVDIKAVRVHKHFLRAEKFYVAIEFRNGATEDVVTYLPRQEADDKQAEILSLIRDGWNEVEPYEYGYETGRADGRSSGWSDGFGAGRSEGYQQGRDNGFAEGKRVLVSELSERREVLMQEQRYADDLPPSRRRYLRSAVSVLTEIIQHYTPATVAN
jgi:hypothetical protein